MKHDFKIRKDKFLDNKVDLEVRIKDLENIMLKRDQTVQIMHMLNPKPDSFYHPNQKMALGYLNPSYLKKAQLKQQSLYNGNLLLEEHDPPAVYDSEETLKLAQESREKMRLLKKEIKPANYAKINHLSGVFVPQTTISKEELFFLNVSNMVTVSKTISIPNEDLSDDTTPSVARKFLNEVKSSLVTLQRVVKQKMTLEVHNWSSSAHKEIQFLQEAVKFVRDFKSLAKEADESLDKQKSLELEIERLLKASVSHDIMSIVQNGFVDVPSDIRTELDRTKEKLELCIIKRKKNTLFFGIIGTQNVKNANITRFRMIKLIMTCNKREFNVVNHRNVIAPRMFKINPSQTPRLDLVHNKQSSASIRTNPITNFYRHVTFKENVSSNTVTASSTRLEHTARTRRPQLKGITRNARIPSASNSSDVKKNVNVKDHRKTLLLSKNQKTMSSECNSVKLTSWNDKSEFVCDTCKQCLVIANHDACMPSSVIVLNSRANKLCTNVPPIANQKRHKTQVWKPKQVGSKERLAPKPRLPRFSLKWLPSGRSFDLKGKLVASKETNYPNDDKACTSNPQEPMRKWFPNLTVFLGRRNTCFIRDLDGVELIKGNRFTNLYTINLYDMESASPICLMARATLIKSWLWHQRLSHLNFDTINDLAKNDLVSSLPKF
nr:integrase, catalytic region, zinc finger, CCHC-type, peptidase aspartic, catalytic [Tanacetum cinerariifolium]